MGDVEVDVDAAAITKLVRSEGPKMFAVALGAAIAQEVRRIAPEGPTGRYRSSIKVTPPTVDTTEVSLDVYSTDFAAHIVEFGSINNQPYAPLRRAPRNLGLPVKDLPK